MTENERKPLIRRVGDALRVLRGRTSDESSRAIIPTTYPTLPNGQQQMALVRTANPGEYRYDGTTIRVQGFNRHPVVHACIRAVADIVASVPLIVLKERGNYEARVDNSHPLQQLLDYPAPRLTARQFRARFAVDYLGYGNAFFQLERPSPNRPPVALRTINAESMQQVWIDPEGDPRRYDYANWAGIIVNIPVEDMLHFRDLDMGRPFEAEVFGYPRGATAIGSMLADNEATNYVRQIVTNDGTPTFAVLLSDEATGDDAMAMQERYKSRVVDRGRRGTPAFFGAVKDIKPLGFTLSDLEFPDLRRVSREDICAAFGVDPRMIGIASASSDAGLSGVQYAEARARLVQHTIEPMFAALEDELNHWLAPEFGDVYVAYDHDYLRDLVENDTETSTRIRAEFDAGLRTFEESRTAIKLSPLPEPTDSILRTMGRELIPAALAVIDPTAIADRPPATDNEMPAEGAPTAEEDIAAEPADAEMLDAEEEDAEEEESDEEEADSEMAPMSEADSEDEDRSAKPLTRSESDAPVDRMVLRRAYWERAMQELDSTEEKYKATAAAQFARERRAVTNAISTASSMANAEGRVRKMYATGGQFEDDWMASFEPLIAKTYQSGARQVAGAGASIPAVLTDPTVRAKPTTSSVAKPSKFTEAVSTFSAPQLKKRALKAIQDRTQSLAQHVSKTTANEVLAAIRAGEKSAMSVAEIARLVSVAVYGEERIDARTTMIARTEAAGAMSRGSWDQAQAEGELFQSKTWLSFEDDRTRDSHALLNGTTIALNEDFTTINGASLQYPLEDSAPAEEVINCRCVLLYETE